MSSQKKLVSQKLSETPPDDQAEHQEVEEQPVELVQVRFPILTELAQRQAQLCKNAEMLHTVAQQLCAVPDVSAAQRLLESLSK